MQTFLNMLGSLWMKKKKRVVEMIYLLIVPGFMFTSVTLGKNNNKNALQYSLQ